MLHELAFVIEDFDAHGGSNYIYVLETTHYFPILLRNLYISYVKLATRLSRPSESFTRALGNAWGPRKAECDWFRAPDVIK
jgi:hypothetical protein